MVVVSFASLDNNGTVLPENRLQVPAFVPDAELPQVSRMHHQSQQNARVFVRVRGGGLRHDLEIGKELLRECETALTDLACDLKPARTEVSDTARRSTIDGDTRDRGVEDGKCLDSEDLVAGGSLDEVLEAL